MLPLRLQREAFYNLLRKLTAEHILKSNIFRHELTLKKICSINNYLEFSSLSLVYCGHYSPFLLGYSSKYLRTITILPLNISTKYNELPVAIIFFFVEYLMCEWSCKIWLQKLITVLERVGLSRLCILCNCWIFI